MADEDPDFSLLPPHVIANILKYLDIEEFREAVLTCKAWYYASCDPRLVRRIEQSIFVSDATAIDINYIERPFNKLYIRSMAFGKINYRLFFNKFGYFIEDIYFDIPKWRLNQLYEMLAYLPNLKQLRINDTNNLISAKNFWPCKRLKRLRNVILKNLRRIEVLRLRICYKEFEGIDQILNYVNVETLSFNEDEGLQQDRDIMMNYILKGLTTKWNTQNLRHLLINSIEEKDTGTFFTQMAYIDHLKLESLNISEISPIFYNYYFKQFCKNFMGLKKFRMKSINENQLKDICNYMKCLEDLELENFVAVNWRYIGQLKQLRNLELHSHVDQEIDEFLSQPLEHLTKLRLNNVSHENLVQICTNYKNLRELHIYVLKTHDCMPIFQNLHKLRVLRMDFEEQQTLNSKYIESSDEFNITNLMDLEELHISCYVSGITLELIKKLSKLITSTHEYIVEDADDPEEEINEDEPNDQEIETTHDEELEAEIAAVVEYEAQQQREIEERVMEDERRALEDAENIENWRCYGDCEWFIAMACDNS